MTKFIYSDGGRKAAGYKGSAGDCVCRAVAIASGLPYMLVYKRLAEGNLKQRKVKSRYYKDHEKIKTARQGISTKRKWFKDYMKSLDFEWVPTLKTGFGNKVRLRKDDLPKGTLVVSVRRHYTTMIDGVIYDRSDPSKNGTVLVRGYWKLINSGSSLLDELRKLPIPPPKPNKQGPPKACDYRSDKCDDCDCRKPLRWRIEHEYGYHQKDLVWSPFLDANDEPMERKNSFAEHRMVNATKEEFETWLQSCLLEENCDEILEDLNGYC